MRVGGAQGVLGRAAEHGAVELGGDAVQDQLAAAVLQPPVKQGPAHPGPGEQRLREHLVLRTSGETSETREETREGTSEVTSEETSETREETSEVTSEETSKETREETSEETSQETREGGMGYDQSDQGGRYGV